MRKLFCIAAVASVAFTSSLGTASAEDYTLYGLTLPPQNGGGFRPAGTYLACAAIEGGRCWDGKAWHACTRPARINSRWQKAKSIAW